MNGISSASHMGNLARASCRARKPATWRRILSEDRRFPSIARSSLSPRPLLPEQTEQHVVLPFAVDAEVFARVAFLAEAAAREEVAARGVVGEASGLDAVQVQAVEGEAQHEAERLLHVAAAGVALAHPVAEAPGLGDAAAHVGEADAAHELAVLAAEHEEAVALVGAPIGGRSEERRVG